MHPSSYTPTHQQQHSSSWSGRGGHTGPPSRASYGGRGGYYTPGGPAPAPPPRYHQSEGGRPYHPDSAPPGHRHPQDSGYRHYPADSAERHEGSNRDWDHGRDRPYQGRSNAGSWRDRPERDWRQPPGPAGEYGQGQGQGYDSRGDRGHYSGDRQGPGQEARGRDRYSQSEGGGRASGEYPGHWRSPSPGGRTWQHAWMDVGRVAVGIWKSGCWNLEEWLLELGRVAGKLGCRIMCWLPCRQLASQAADVVQAASQPGC